MICPKCGEEETIEVYDAIDRADGGVDELCRCGCGYQWTVVNPGDKYLKRVIDRLKTFQSGAINIQFDVCHCRSKALMLTYQTGKDRARDGDKESCGYWCAKCGFGNAGSRPVVNRTENEG